MSLTVIGNGSFVQSGNARWRRDGWGLDQLIVPYQGSYSNLDLFIGGLTLWASSSRDGNMFLSDWVIDSEPVKPTVELIFIGKKGGVLPPAKRNTASTLQSVQFIMQFGGFVSALIAVQYLSPTNTASWIGTAANTGGDVADPTGEPVIVGWQMAGINSTTPSVITPEITAAVRSFMKSFFPTEIVPSTRSEELVPNHYYQNFKSKTFVYIQ